MVLIPQLHMVFSRPETQCTSDVRIKRSDLFCNSIGSMEDRKGAFTFAQRKTDTCQCTMLQSKGERSNRPAKSASRYEQLSSASSKPTINYLKKKKNHSKQSVGAPCPNKPLNHANKLLKKKSSKLFLPRIIILLCKFTSFVCFQSQTHFHLRSLHIAN